MDAAQALAGNYIHIGDSSVELLNYSSNYARHRFSAMNSSMFHENATNISTNPYQPVILTAEQTEAVLRKNRSLKRTHAITIAAPERFSQNTHLTEMQTPEQAKMQTGELKKTASSSEQTAGDQNVGEKIRPYSCEECAKSFLMKHHLTNHMLIHKDVRAHVCEQCQRSFVHKHALKTHMMLHSNERRFECTECKKRFTLKHHLVSHMRIHSRERPFRCDECGRSFALKHHLVKHAKFHAGELPFACSECDESFGQEDHLIKHRRFHGSSNPYNCDDCGANFFRKFELVEHARLHGNVPYKCTVCCKEFQLIRSLTTHMCKHGSKQPYRCVNCVCSFDSKAELQLHIRNAHDGVNENTCTDELSVMSSPKQEAQQQQQLQSHTQSLTELSNAVNSAAPSQELISKSAYECRQCAKKFRSVKALSLHMRVHMTEPTTSNDYCELSPYAANYSANNEQISTGIVSGSEQNEPYMSNEPVEQLLKEPKIKLANYSCYSCGKIYAAKHGLKQHTDRHPDGSCTVASHICECGKAFFQRNHLILHQRQHLMQDLKNSGIA